MLVIDNNASKLKKETKPAPKVVKYKVKTLLNVREAPNMNSKILGVNNAGDVIEVISETTDWVQSAAGYHMKKFLDKI